MGRLASTADRAPRTGVPTDNGYGEQTPFQTATRLSVQGPCMVRRSEADAYRVLETLLSGRI